MAGEQPEKTWKMRVSFDLDEVLFVSPLDHKTEKELPFPWRSIFRERVRLGTPRLIRALQEDGFEVWVYTTSFRSETYIRQLFRLYGVRFDGIVNGQRHAKEVQGRKSEPQPNKLPSRYGISLHVDDESIVAVYGKMYGFDVFELNAQDDDWADKIIERARSIRRKEKERES